MIIRDAAHRRCQGVRLSRVKTGEPFRFCTNSPKFPVRDAEDLFMRCWVSTEYLDSRHYRCVNAKGSYVAIVNLRTGRVSIVDNAHYVLVRDATVIDNGVQT